MAQLKAREWRRLADKLARSLLNHHYCQAANHDGYDFQIEISRWKSADGLALEERLQLSLELSKYSKSKSSELLTCLTDPRLINTRKSLPFDGESAQTLAVTRKARQNQSLHCSICFCETLQNSGRTFG